VIEFAFANEAMFAKLEIFHIMIQKYVVIIKVDYCTTLWIVKKLKLRATRSNGLLSFNRNVRTTTLMAIMPAQMG
jgi:hypothetical protein